MEPHQRQSKREEKLAPVLINKRWSNMQLRLILNKWLTRTQEQSMAKRTKSKHWMKLSSYSSKTMKLEMELCTQARWSWYWTHLPVNKFILSMARELRNGETMPSMRAIGEMAWLRVREHFIMLMEIYTLDNFSKIVPTALENTFIKMVRST